MSYGELYIPTERVSRNLLTGRFMKGHVPANKGKKWQQYMSKKSMRQAMKGWKNLNLHRNKNGRADTAGRCRKKVIAVLDDGKWLVFDYLKPAADFVGGNRENVGRCCRQNEMRKELRNTHGKAKGVINTEHRYKGVRFYFESDNVWMEKINERM